MEVNGEWQQRWVEPVCEMAVVSSWRVSERYLDIWPRCLYKG